MTVASAILVIIGAIFCFLAALGVLRFPDVYTRTHAASKAGALGAGLILLGAGMASNDPGNMLRSLIGLVFLIVTAPVSAHLLARAALKTGTAPVATTSIDRPLTVPDERAASK
jgi:multicomponent Na+:H+ antiporter subunit G